MRFHKATFKAIVQNKPNKNGVWPIKLRVTYKGKPTLVSLPYTATKDDLKTVNGKLSLKQNHMVTDIVEDLVKNLNTIAVFISEDQLGDITPGQAFKIIYDRYTKGEEKKPKFQLDFPTYMRRIADTKKPATKKSYLNALKALSSFMGKDEYDISEIKSSTLTKFETFLENKYGNYTKTIPLYVGNIATVHKHARKEFNSEEENQILIKNPFAYFEHNKKVVHRKEFAAPREMIQYMIDHLKDFNNEEKKAATLFLLMFSLQGMNMADIMYARPPKDNVLEFQRTKIKDSRPDDAETKVKIHDCVKPLHEYFKDPEGKYAYYFANRYKLDYIHQQETKWMKALRARLKLEEQFRDTADRLKFNSARHSYPTLSVAMGISKDIVNDGMSHINKRTEMTDRYITKDWTRIWEANRVLLKSFDWSGLRYL